MQLMGDRNIILWKYQVNLLSQKIIIFHKIIF